MGIERLSNGKWRADFYLGPVRKQVTMANRRLLEMQIIKLKNDYQEGKITGKRRDPSISFQEAAEQFYRLYAVPNGQQEIWHSLIKLIEFFDGSTPLNAITPERIKEWRSMMLEKHPMSTVKRRYTVVRGIFREAVQNGKLKINPCDGLFRKQWRGLDNPRQRFFSDEETQKVYDFIRDVMKDEEMLVYAIVARNTGFRENNITGLEWTDVNFAQGTVRARQTKTDKFYSVRMNPSCKKALLLLWERNGRPAHGKCFRPIHWSIKFVKLFQRLGWHTRETPKTERAVLHTFRHTYCSQMVMKGYNERTIMAAMGWSNTTQMKTYAHLAPDYLQTAVNSVDCGPRSEAMPSVLNEIDLVRTASH